MDQGKSMSGTSRKARVEDKRNHRIILQCFIAVWFFLQVFSQSAAAEPVVKVLFGGNECSFLSKSLEPAWVSKRPDTDDFVGISSAGRSSSDRQLNPTEQTQMAELNARTALASEISVRVNETTTQFMSERYGETKEGISREVRMEIESEAKQVVDQTLSGSRIVEKYLDQQNCIVHAQARITKAAVDEERRKLAEKLRRLFRYKHLMVLDRSDAPGAMSTAIYGHVSELFMRIGSKLVAADAGHAVCADDPLKAVCQKPDDMIYAGYKVVLDKEGTAADLKRRIYKLIGSLRFKERMIASFDVACQGTGRVGQDYVIDQQAAKACFDRTRPIIERGMEGAE